MIQINYRDGRPFYEQIKENIRKMITSHVLKPDDKLPSVRDLAAQLAINPNTIQRAYRELEHEGYIFKVPGRGTFIAEVPDADSPRKQELLKEFDNITSELFYLAVTREELIARIHIITKKEAYADDSSN